MNAIDAVCLGERHDPLDVEIRADRLTWLADEISLVGLETMEREAVFVRIDGHRADAELVG